MRSFKAGDNVSGTVGGSFAHAIWNNRVNDSFSLEEDFNDVISHQGDLSTLRLYANFQTIPL